MKTNEFISTFYCPIEGTSLSQYFVATEEALPKDVLGSKGRIGVGLYSRDQVARKDPRVENYPATPCIVLVPRT